MTTLTDLDLETQALYTKGPRPDGGIFGLTPQGQDCYMEDTPETMLEIDKAYLEGEARRMVG